MVNGTSVLGNRPAPVIQIHKVHVFSNRSDRREKRSKVYFPACSQAGKVGARKKIRARKYMHKTAGVPDQQCKTRLHWLERSLKLNCRPITMPIVPGCSKLALGRLSFGTQPLQWLIGAMQISVIGHPLEVPFQALQGYFITSVAGSFRFQAARGSWPGAMA